MAVTRLEPALRPDSGAATGVPSDVRLRLPLVRQGVLGDVAVLAAAALGIALVGLPSTAGLVLLALVAAWRVYSFVALPMYERAVSFTPVVRLAQVLGAAAVGVVLLGVSDEATVRRGAIALAVVVVASVLSTVTHRVLLRRKRTVLIGTADRVEHLAERWADRDDVDVVDTYGWAHAADLSRHREAVIADVLASVAGHGATSVVVASGSALASPALRQLAWALRRADVECLVVADMSDHAEALRPRRIADQTAMSLRSPHDRLAADLTRSVIDRVGAAVGLVVLSPLLLAVAVAIRLDSHGPAVFSQVRAGRDGAPFTMYKFRSMVTDAETRLADLLDLNEGAGPLFKMAQDPRITRLGRFLRRTSIDELLQLVNVLKGEMSLVGPRPALLSEIATYDPWTRRRLDVRPGLTGLWQVSGRSSLTWEESVRKDLEYVNHQSLRLDLSILLRTAGAVLRREGAH